MQKGPLLAPVLKVFRRTSASGLSDGKSEEQCFAKMLLDHRSPRGFCCNMRGSQGVPNLEALLSKLAPSRAACSGSKLLEVSQCELRQQQLKELQQGGIPMWWLEDDCL